ncbi:MAG: ComEC/Rec2 family competence protein [Bacilli bacterium]|jgi:competence protein ComEC
MAKKVKSGALIGAAIFGLIVGGALGGAGAFVMSPKPDSYEIPATEKAHNPKPATIGEDFNVETIKAEDFSIHFMELGNKYTGDSTLVKAGDVEVLIDAGSRVSSVDTIHQYASQYVKDKLDYIVVTHAHEDHYAGFATNKYEDSIFAKFDVGVGTTIIDFAKITTKKATNKMYQNYQANLNTAITNGALHYTCAELVDEGNQVINLSPKVKMEILKTKYYYEVSNTENNHSVCTLFSCGTLHYLLTGDLEASGEESLVTLNTLPQVELYKAGHHGSKTSSTKKLMDVIKPKVISVCCCAGSSEYTKTDANQFPTQVFINNVAAHTDKVFVTTQCVDYDKGLFAPMNGTIIACQKQADEQATIYCTNNTTILKDSDWFKAHRTWPDS